MTSGGGDAGGGAVTAGAAGIVAGFAAAFGGSPDGVWRAPGRVNLIGEHTDYNDGFVMPFAIDRETLVAARLRDDGVLTCASAGRGPAPDVRVADLAPGGPRGWWSYVHGAVFEVSRLVGEVLGADVFIDSTVPVGAGLSSSAALECAVSLAVADLHGASIPRTELALAAQRAEHAFAGVPCGVMDQMAAVHGRPGHALLLDTRSLEIRPVPFPPPRLSPVVVDTRVSHALDASPYAERRRSCEEAARALGVRALRDLTPEALDEAAPRLDSLLLRRARHVITENRRVLDAADALRAGALDRLAGAITGSHRSLRDDFEVSSAELDLAVDAAMDAGALAARLTGAGFGGSIIALVPDEVVDPVELQVLERFAAAGLRRPGIMRVVPSEGASRVL